VDARRASADVLDPTFPKIAALYVAGTGETYVGLTDAIPGQKFESMQLYGSLLFRRAP
jgi:hypothetical protein